MRRLYLQIYISLIGILVLFGILASIAWWVASPRLEEIPIFEEVGALLGDWLPGPDRPAEELQESLERLGSHIPAHFNVRGPDGALLASVGDTLPAPGPDRTRSGWMRSRGEGATVAFHLPDGRWLVARHIRDDGETHAIGGLTILGLLAIAVGVGAYPVVRRLTRRLERLQTRVDALGAGDLSARVEVEGSDEVASLARSFNRAAGRIENLVEAQKNVLAGASHELRTPLARLSVAVELLAKEDRPELRERISKDIAELDELIGELLLASRLDTAHAPETTDEIDLLALLAEEGARTHATVSGEPVNVQGDPRLLRRMIRNLLENAERYAGESPVEASVVPLGPAGARLLVEDRGPGVPETERERIFEPFYQPSGLRKTTDRGVGLGLALVRQIARHHRGEARCYPREGGGTCFEVILNAEGRDQVSDSATKS
jgi:signal transduction histidine kinase